MNARTILSFVTPSTRLAAGLFGALIACLSLFSTPAYAADDWDVIRVTGYRYANTPSGGGIQYAIGRYADRITFNRADVYGGRRGGVQQRSTAEAADRCRHLSEAAKERCNAETIFQYARALDRCDEAFSRRFRGSVWGIQGIFSFQLASTNQRCRADADDRKLAMEANCAFAFASDLDQCNAL